jgi:site-specific recombinase XerD
MSVATFPSLLQSFFTERLQSQRCASPHTIASYRDSFRLLLRFASTHLHKSPSDLMLEDLNAELVARFLDSLQRERNVSARSRNVRLAAIHSFFRYVALAEPTYILHCQRVLAIPSKRYERTQVTFLDEQESRALLAAPDRSTWTGRRDQTLMLVALQTGLRVSELIHLRCDDVALGTGAHVRCRGKGRKQRSTPLGKDVARSLKQWLEERRGQPTDPVFPSSRGGPLSPDALQRVVALHAATARRSCPSLQRKRVTPHCLRHSAAMSLLRSGVDRSVIALWLGHECVETTQIYLHADLRLKEKALSRTTPNGTKTKRYRPSDRVLAFLESL